MTRTYWWLELREPKNLEEGSSAIIYGEDQDNGQLNLHESLQVVDRKRREARARTKSEQVKAWPHPV